MNTRVLQVAAIDEQIDLCRNELGKLTSYWIGADESQCKKDEMIALERYERKMAE